MPHWTMMPGQCRKRCLTDGSEVMRQIVETYNLPNMDFRNLEDRQEYDTDVLRAFSEACREDLHV